MRKIATWIALSVIAALPPALLSGCATLMSLQQRAEAAYCRQPLAARQAYIDAWNAQHPEVQLHPKPCDGDVK